MEWNTPTLPKNVQVVKHNVQETVSAGTSYSSWDDSAHAGFVAHQRNNVYLEYDINRLIAMHCYRTKTR
jgi:hypothetical protein